MGWLPGDVAAAKGELAAPRRRQAEDRAQRRGLSGAVGAQQSHDLRLPHGQAGAKQRLGLPVERLDIRQLQHHANLPKLEA